MNDLCKQLNFNRYWVSVEFQRLYIGFICLDMSDNLSLWFYIVKEF